jgi:5'-nucleotidase
MAISILITNDDGILSDGISVLRRHLMSLGEVWTVAPDGERNAVSHALTLHRPLRLSALDDRSYAVNGTPADCINIALHHIVPSPPQLIVSGINRGANLGSDLNYSGTLAGAFEGARMGIAAFSISLAAERTFDYVPAARFALRLAGYILEHGLPADTMLNVNVPDTGGNPIECFRITRQGAQRHRNTIEQKTDPRGMNYYWIGRVADGRKSPEDDDACDYRAIEDGVVSVTPLCIDRTNHRSCKLLADWNV